MTIPLLILAAFSLMAGFIEWPHNLAHFTLFSNLVQQTLPATLLKTGSPPEGIFQLIAVATTFIGIYIGYVFYYKNKGILAQWKQAPAMEAIQTFFLKGWGFDQLYQLVFVRPFLYITNLNKTDFFDQVNKGVAWASHQLNKKISISQNGSLRWYVAGVLAGILFILTLQFLL
jgi:NADH-quinone oxidoreductase subunit L